MDPPGDLPTAWVPTRLRHLQDIFLVTSLGISRCHLSEVRRPTWQRSARSTVRITLNRCDCPSRDRRGGTSEIRRGWLYHSSCGPTYAKIDTAEFDANGMVTEATVRPRQDRAARNGSDRRRPKLRPNAQEIKELQVTLQLCQEKRSCS